MKTLIAAGLACALALAVAAGAATQEPEAGSLAPAQGPAPPPVVYTDKAPGESARLPRPWLEAPPLVPHSLEGLVPITREENACVMCHATEGDADGPPALPSSHILRPSNGGEPALAGARWVCTTCHVPQSNAPPFPPK
ncbi:MAG: nitrate reductase cytochrome c-type subunit [Acidobacteriota bacterium]